MDKALVFGTKDCRFESCQGHALRIAAPLRRRVFRQGPWLPCQFARVVKGLDLRSNAGNCAWVRTPQLAHSLLPSDGLVPSGCSAICEAQRLYSSVVERQSCKLKVLGSIPSGGYAFLTGRASIRATPARKLTLAGLEPAIFGSEDQRLFH